LGGVHQSFQIQCILCDSWSELHQNAKNSQDSKMEIWKVLNFAKL
jgi:hypothetical protein